MRQKRNSDRSNRKEREIKRYKEGDKEEGIGMRAKEIHRNLRITRQRENCGNRNGTERKADKDVDKEISDRSRNVKRHREA